MTADEPPPDTSLVRMTVEVSIPGDVPDVIAQQVADQVFDVLDEVITSPIGAVINFLSVIEAEHDVKISVRTET